MNQPVEQFKYENSKLLKTNPKKPTPSQDSVAIIVHIFYIDIWKEILHYLQQIHTSYDLYITVPHNMSQENIKYILKTHSNTTLFMVENRGRDVLPFLETLNIIGVHTYKYICKIHTKKTEGSALGNVWRKLLYFDLLGSDKIVEDILQLFEENTDIGIITGKNTILDSQKYTYGNNEKLQMLAEKSSLVLPKEYLFPAGTMFWIKTELLESIMYLFKNKLLHFENEKGQKDNTLAHAIERFFGIISKSKKKKIIASPALYSNTDDKTLHELAALVLAQQYHGKDVFTEQNKHIEELQILAESLRIKNRIKRLVPQNIKTILKKIKTYPNTALQVYSTTKNNPQVLKKVFYYLRRGEFKYLLKKAKEKSSKNLNKNTSIFNLDPHTYFKNYDKEEHGKYHKIIDIIIPVYNGYSFLEPLFSSIERNTSSPYRLIVIDDCSPDEKIKPFLLKKLKKHPSSIFVHNKKNLGFVKSVNKGITYVENNFVILNTDTEVPSLWLERLMRPIDDLPNIASTTPFTNAGTIASFPIFLEDNEIFENLSVDELDESFKKINPTDLYIALPTGVGFCMGVNHKLVQQIGFFDEATFNKGYGEENDWCQRAIEHGYTNILVPNLFVYHKHGGSFSPEKKQKFVTENYLKLLKKHPHYDKEVQDYITKNPHHDLRQILIMLASCKKEKITLIFDHALGGGANIYTDELIQKYKTQNKNILLVQYDLYANKFKCFHYYKHYEFSFTLSSFEGLQELLPALTIQEVFLNNIVSFKNSYLLMNYLYTFVENNHIKLTIPIHDFYSICPSYTLQDSTGKYCNVPDIDTCNSCMQKNNLEWKNLYTDKINMPLWRESWLRLLKQSTSILCFSNSSKEILLKAYPDLSNNKIEVIPHEVAPLSSVVSQEKKRKSSTITIGVLGAINHAKGAQVIRDLVQAIEKDTLDVKIVLIGETSEHIKSKYFHATGRYTRKELPSIVQDNHIDIFLIPSIWPETFSYTTQEIIMMKLPLIVFNLGAPSERIKDYDKGHIVDIGDIKEILNIIQTL